MQLHVSNGSGMKYLRAYAFCAIFAAQERHGSFIFAYRLGSHFSRSACKSQYIWSGNGAAVHRSFLDPICMRVSVKWCTFRVAHNISADPQSFPWTFFVRKRFTFRLAHNIFKNMFFCTRIPGVRDLGTLPVSFFYLVAHMCFWTFHVWYVPGDDSATFAHMVFTGLFFRA